MGHRVDYLELIFVFFIPWVLCLLNDTEQVFAKSICTHIYLGALYLGVLDKAEDERT